VLWVCAAAVFAGSLIAASQSCDFWEGSRVLPAMGAVFVSVTFAVYVRQREPDTTLGVVFPLAMGIAAGICTFFGVLFCSLGLAHCG
jgi:hypothetical protein